MARLAAFHTLWRQLDGLRPRAAAAQCDGFFPLVGYMLRAAALANERHFALESEAVGTPALRAHRAGLRLKALTARYNAGRWAGILLRSDASERYKMNLFRRWKPWVLGDRTSTISTGSVTASSSPLKASPHVTITSG